MDKTQVTSPVPRPSVTPPVPQLPVIPMYPQFPVTPKPVISMYPRLPGTLMNSQTPRPSVTPPVPQLPVIPMYPQFPVTPKPVISMYPRLPGTPMNSQTPVTPPVQPSPTWLERDDQSEQSPIWDICEEITTKHNWYSKVFQEDIVNKWRQEIPSNASGEFDFAIKLLKASAQGCNLHMEEPKYRLNQITCDWDDKIMCDDCKSKLKQEILDNPEELGVSPDDLNDFFDGCWEHDFEDWAEENCNHTLCKCKTPDHLLTDYVNYHPKGLIPDELHSECQSVIAEMSSQEPIDWHPDSDQQVRDLIHPSMYCYVKGVSLDKNNEKLPECEENVRYQWLPSKFTVGLHGKVKVDSYINNLKADKYPRFIPLIEEVFERFIPSLEGVLNKQIKGSPLQVIIKVGSIHLDKDKLNYPGGSWHVEGMPYEQIAATCIHYVDAENITDSFLEFRKPVIINEENLDYPQSNGRYTTHHYGIEPGSHHEGEMNRYLGLIRCHEGASIVFPNTLQHRVKDFSLVSGKESALRTILAFFVIDPDHPIISTEDIPPQQNIFTPEQANHHRERLMFHRKYFVNQLNEAVYERNYSLCEH